MSWYEPDEPRYREEVSLRKKEFHPVNYVDVVLTYNLTTGAFRARGGRCSTPIQNRWGYPTVTITSNYSGYSYEVTRRGPEDYTTDNRANGMRVETVCY
ncbi:hypothetical protein AWC38_SpisGene19888 [Stylophora pistillata]|uniref:Uncharacterized protein n=1 Tax=Stylophora pistillata TaxID=50429 RepID=A0A2B4RC07_STYPI|nr:hypothetical protein AWC38_SpisGene19888 [Stylophora pistillata]